MEQCLHLDVEKSAKGPVSRILSCAVIPLGAASPRTLISDLPGGFGDCIEQPCGAGPAPDANPAPGARLPPYLVLLRVGFTMPPALPPERCALTAPFHPYRRSSRPGLRPSGQSCVCRNTRIRRYLFCGTGRLRALKPTSRTLSGTLPCGVRTFLPRWTPLTRGQPAATARSSCQ